jgi:hypothetical protein
MSGRTSAGGFRAACSAACPDYVSARAVEAALEVGAHDGAVIRVADGCGSVS